MCCWFWCIKTSKGEGNIHLNTQWVHVMNFILLLDGSHSGKTHVITVEKISVLTRYSWCIIPSTWGKYSRDTFDMKYFSLQQKEIWEEYLKCEMILHIDIFSRAYMSYGNVLLVTASCTQCYDDSDEIATIMEGDVCTSGMHNRFTWLGLIIHSGVYIRRDDQCFNLLLWCYHFDLCWVHVYIMTVLLYGR